MDNVCGTCQFFTSDALGNPRSRSTRGTCAHPRHRSHGVGIVIFAQETRCRRGFGEDDWSPAGALRGNPLPETASGPRDDILIDERTSPSDRVRRTFPFLAPVPIYVDREETLAD